jgi:hypothetical protein
VKRTVLLAGIGVVTLGGGVAAAAILPANAPVQLRSAATTEEPTTTTWSVPPTTATTCPWSPELPPLTMPPETTESTEPPNPAPASADPSDTTVGPATTVPRDVDVPETRRPVL